MRVPTILIICFCWIHLVPAQGEAIFVDSMQVNMDGLSWATAFNNLEDAITMANPGDTIFLASGTYFPENAIGRMANFTLKDSIVIMGGFVGLGHRPANPLEKDTLGETILSGDIGIRGDDSDNVYHILFGANVNGIEIYDISLVDGNANFPAIGSNNARGGAIYLNESSIKLKNCRFLDNQAIFLGGAIFANTTSKFVLDSCRFEGNSAGPLPAGPAFSQGGAISSFGSVFEITHSVFINNQALEGRAGAFQNATSTRSFIRDTRFEGNVSRQGGAMFFGSSSPSLKDCQFLDNRASFGGAIFAGTSEPSIESCIFLRNQATDPVSIGHGGAMFLEIGGNPSIRKSVFSENRADDLGGAIFSEDASSPLITESIFSSNTAKQGGAAFFQVAGSPILNFNFFISNSASINGGALVSQISNSSPQIFANTFWKNKAQRGGAIYNGLGSRMSVQNSTIIENEASIDGGGIFSENELAILSSTICDNRAPNSQGQQLFLEEGLSSIKNTIIAETQRDRIQDIFIAPLANLNSQGFNFFRETVSIQLDPTDIIDSSAAVFSAAGLSPNGGLLVGTDSFERVLPSYAILPGGLLENAGEAFAPSTPLVDTRGYFRIQGAGNTDRIDIGAYEIQKLFTRQFETRFCTDDVRFIDVGVISILDSTGGALKLGDSLQYRMEIPPQMELELSDAQVEVSNPQLEVYDLRIENNELRFSYNKSYNNSLIEINIAGLKARLTDAGLSFLTLKNSDALQDPFLASDSLIHGELDALPSISILPNMPYEDDFESGEGIWLSSEAEGGWIWQVPDGNVIDTAYSGSFAWLTEINPRNRNYFPDQVVEVSSQCLDLSALEKPMIQAAVWSDTEAGFDGTVLQYSTDAGKSWEVLGEAKTGINWFNSNSILANPGDQDVGDQLGWTGKTNGWITIANKLDQLARENLLRFRFAFSSVALVDTSQEKNGFAIDDIFIGDRSRNVLLEDFGDPNELQELDGFLAGMDKEVFQISYELESSEFNAQSAGPRTRALFYGIDQAGPIAFGGNGFLGAASEMDQEDFDAEILQKANFLISIDSTSSEAIQIKALEDVENEILVHAAIVEREKDSWKFRKFLPDPAGVSVVGWQAEENKSFDLNWDAEDFPAPSIVDQYDSLQLVVFVQELATKKIQQAAISPVWESLIKRSDVEKKESPEGELARNFKLYPNPSSGQLYLEIPDGLTSAFDFELYNNLGQLVYQTELPANSQLIQLELGHIGKGLYHANLTKEGIIQHRRKVYFIH